MNDKPGIFELARDSVSRALAAFRAMPLLFLAYFAASAVITLAALQFAPRNRADLADVMLLGLATIPFETAAASAFAVAVHRFVILSEVNGTASLAAHWRAIAEFFVTSLAIGLLAIVLVLVGLNVRASGVPSWLLVALAIGAVYVALRVFLIFPAIAVDAPGRGLVVAFRASRGLVLRLVATTLIIALPIAIASGLVSYLLGLGKSPSVLAALLDCAVDLVILVTGVTVVSRLFMWREETPLNAPVT